MARTRLRELRRRSYHVLEQGPVGDRLSTWIDRLLVILILINLIAVTLESMPKYEARYGTAFAVIEFFSLVIFTVEYGLRLWSSVEDGPNQHLSPTPAPPQYALSPARISRPLAGLPFCFA